jgi:Bacterial antitoxin of type II TA system, VapB
MPSDTLLGMARVKATITVDRAKLERARAVTGSATASATIDLALDELLRVERIRRDVAAYLEHPPSPEERSLARPGHASSVELADDTDWEALYPRDS